MLRGSMFRGRALRGLRALFFCLLAAPVCGDTVYLYNGTTIDGVIKARHEASIELEIGSLGRVFIDLEAIESIEKNDRDGTVQDSRLSLAGKRSDMGGAGGVENADDQGAPAGQGEAGGTNAPGGTASDTVADAPPAAAKRYLKKEDVEPKLRKTIQEYVTELTRHRRQVRVRAERRLLEIGEPAVPFLLDVVTHENHLVRMAALRIFKEVGNEAVIGAVINRLGDDNGYVRLTAVETLRQLTRQNFGFQHNGSAASRQKAIDAWRAWHEKQTNGEGEAASEAPAAPGSSAAGSPAKGLLPTPKPAEAAGDAPAPSESVRRPVDR